MQKTCFIFILLLGFSVKLKAQGLSVTGTIDATNLTITGTIQGGTFSGTLGAGTLNSITSIGTLSSLTVTGLATVSNLSVTNNITGTLQTAAQPNITSLGTLSNLTVSGLATISNLSVTNNITGTLQTAAQPNITSLGTISNLTVSGRATISNLSVTNNITAASVSTTGTITAGNSIGYNSGGATVTQLTNKSTGVTINSISGQITTANSTITNYGVVEFTVTNSFVGAKDVPFVAIASGATAGTYLISVTKVAAGSFNIMLYNMLNSVTAANILVINFVIFKGA